MKRTHFDNRPAYGWQAPTRKSLTADLLAMSPADRVAFGLLAITVIMAARFAWLALAY